MSELSLAALTILDAGPAGQIKAAHEAGFKSVGLRLQPLLPSDRKIVGDREAMQEVESLIAATGMHVLEIGVFPIRANMDLEALSPVLSFSHKIGAQFIVCPVEDDDKARRVETFSTLCDLAESCALDVLVEFNPYSACRSLAEALEMVKACGRPNGKLLVDAFHLSRSGGHPREVAAIDKPLLPLVHLCDAPPLPPAERSEDEVRKESRTSRLLPGEGSLWLKELMAALPADVAISIEAPAAQYAHLPAAERARLALQATQKLLRG
jgi:sugar phosphate isomerase/epimerase